MKSLFGLGMHPNAGAIEEQLAERGGDPHRGRVGRRARASRSTCTTRIVVFNVQVARGVHDVQPRSRQKWNAPIPVEERARIRTEIGTRMFAEQHGRAAAGRTRALRVHGPGVTAGDHARSPATT